MRTEVLPKFDKNGDGKISIGEGVGKIASEISIMISSGVSPYDSVSDEFGIMKAFQRKIAITIVQYAFVNFWYAIIPAIIAFFLLLYSIFTKTTRNRLPMFHFVIPYHMMPPLMTSSNLCNTV